MSSSPPPDPDPVRAWFVNGPTTRGLRALVRASTDPEPVLVILAPGVPLPEVLPAGAWSDVVGRRVAALPLEVAAQLAEVRGAGSARRMRGASAGADCVWCLYLEPGGTSSTWTFPLVMRHPREPGDGPPVGDA